MAVATRSKSVTGPWENSPYNPVVHTYSAHDNWWSKGHGTLIDDVNGNWWIVYHAYAKGYHTLGRSTLIEPLNGPLTDGIEPNPPPLPSRPIRPSNTDSTSRMISQDRNWDSNGLSGKNMLPQSLSFKKQTLWMDAKGSTPSDARLLLTTAEDKNYETQVEVNVGKGNTAGLLLYYSEKAYFGVVSDGKDFTIYRNAEKSFTLPNKLGKRFFAKIQNQGNSVRLAVSKDGKEWTTLVGEHGCISAAP